MQKQPPDHESRKFRVLFVYPNLMLQTTFPLAFAIFSAILKKNGFEVDVFDTTFYRTEEISSDERRVENLQLARFNLGADFENLPEKEQMLTDLRKKVEAYQPNLIAFSVLEDLYTMAQELLAATRHLGIPTVAGGLFPTFAPEQVLANDGIDMICIGEGEETLLELCTKMRDNADYTNVKNLWIKRGEKTIRNKLRPPRDLNTNPPPDFELFDERRFYRPMKGKLYRMGLVETNRGCPYTCAFCNSYAQSVLYKDHCGKPYFRSRDVGKIHDEIKRLVDVHKVEFIYFPAEVLLAGTKEYREEFVRMYKQFKLPFFCQNRAEVITEETVRDLVEMNCHGCAIGIEHGNEEFRRTVLNRRVSNATYVDAVGLLAKTDIKVSVNNIIGFPDETRELVFVTIELNRKLNAYQINAYFYVPYHGTHLRDYCVDKEYIAADAQTSYITKDTILKMPQLSSDEIRGLVRTFTLYAKFPRDRFSDIAIAERNDGIGNATFDALRREYWSKYLR